MPPARLPRRVGGNPLRQVVRDDRRRRLVAVGRAELLQKRPVPLERLGRVMLLAPAEEQVAHLRGGESIRLDRLVLHHDLVVNGERGLLAAFAFGQVVLFGIDLDVPGVGLLAISGFGLTHFKPPGRGWAGVLARSVPNRCCGSGLLSLHAVQSSFRGVVGTASLSRPFYKSD